MSGKNQPCPKAALTLKCPKCPFRFSWVGGKHGFPDPPPDPEPQWGWQGQGSTSQQTGPLCVGVRLTVGQ